MDPALQERMIRALDAATRRIAELEAVQSRPIAIVGIGCRFPGGVDGPEAFWRLLDDGVDAVTEYPRERWEIDAIHDPTPGTPGASVARAGGWLEEVDRFDAAFFGMTPREARALDPQHRILLEVAWDAFASAGQPRERLRGSATGVFVGISNGDYGRLGARSPGREALDSYYITGNTLNAAAGRIAYWFGLQGPCFAIDTACSSSLSALHAASRALQGGECEIALAAGVNLVLSPEGFIALSQAGVLSPDGRCRAFAADASGMGRGEGCAAVVLKPLDAALRDGDPVRAVIRGTAANQDGASGGLTIPNGPAQVRVIRAALRRAGVEPADVDYVEAHGTGTPLGDPIEIQALGEAYGEGRNVPLLVGSVKTNIAHGESSAGMAGLLKVVLALQNERIPRHLHAGNLSPRIPWNELPVAVTSEGAPWPRGGRPRRAGLSGFGFSGSNVHVILEEAPAAPPVPPVPGPEQRAFPVLVSAATPRGVAARARAVAARLRASSAGEARGIGAWLALRTSHLPCRAAVAVDLAAPGLAADRLEEFAAHGESPGVQARTAGGIAPRPVFLFTGQGSQAFGMGRDLYAAHDVVRRTLDEADTLVRPRRDHALLDVMFRDPACASLLDRTEYTQPALFALEIAVHRLWAEHGVEPSACVGHSIGEVAAACAAGVFGFEDGMTLVLARSELMQAIDRDGAMAAILAPESVVRDLLDDAVGSIAVAAMNAPDNTVISGDRAAVEAASARAAASGLVTKPLAVSHAFHSPHIDGMLDAFRAAISGIAFAPPRLPIRSNRDGADQGAAMAAAEYWVRQVREPVRFADGIMALGPEPRVFVEIGPHPVLSGFIPAIRGPIPGATNDVVIASQRRGADGALEWAGAMGGLFTAGVSLDGSRVFPGVRPRAADLPPYPFERERFWYEWDDGSAALGGAAASAPVSGPLPLRRVSWRALPPLPVGGDPRPRESWIVAAEPAPGAASWAAAIVRALEECGDVVTRADAETIADRIAMAEERGPVRLLILPDGSPGCDSKVVEACVFAQALLARAASASERHGRILAAWIVTRGAEAAAGPAVSVRSSAVLGLARAFAAERPGMWGGSLDLDPSDDLDGGEAAARERAVATLLAAIRGSRGEDRIAIRGGSILVARLEACRPEDGATGETASSPQLARSGWVITGGFGGVGLAIARHLARQGVRRLVLASRRAPGPTEEDHLAALGAEGAEVVAVRADVATPEGLDAVLNAAAASADAGDAGAPPAGIVMAAGVLEDAPFADLDHARLARVHAPKSAAAGLLARALAARGWSHVPVLLCSSIAALFGSPGQAAYAAANAALDALASQARGRGERWMSIQWGPWRDAGMAARLGSVHRARLEARGLLPMPDARALAALDLARSGTSDGVVAAFDADWTRLAAEALSGRRLPLLDEIAPAPDRTASTPAPGAGDLYGSWCAAPVTDRDAVIVAAVQQRIVRALGLPEDRLPDPAVALADYGVDSMIATELRNRLARSSGVEIPLAAFIDGSGAGAIARRIADAFAARRIIEESRGGSAAAAEAASGDDDVEIEI